MILITKYNWLDPIGIYTRYSSGQAFIASPLLASLALGSSGGATASTGGIGLGSALLGSTGISAGTSLLGGLLGGKSSSTKKISTFSKNQKNVDKLLYDWMMGITRNAKGDIVSQNPILSQLMAKKYPQMKVAPFTDTQNQLLGIGRGMIGKATNLARPDANRQSQLAMGITPSDSRWKSSPGYMKDGGILPPGQSATVGEDGTEQIIALPGGGVEVIPNPKSLKPDRMGTVLKKMAATTKKTGLPAMAISAPSYMRKYGNYYLPDTMTQWQGAWDTTKPYATEAQKGFNEYLANKYAGQNDSWYNTLQKEAGGDISNVGWGNSPGGKNWIDTKGTKYWQKGVQEGYGQDLQDWWNSLERVQGVEDVTSATSPFGYLNDTDLASGFGNYLSYGGSAYAPSNWGSANQWGMYTDPNTGQITWGFSDPYSVDTGVLNEGVNAYLTEKGYQLNPTSGQWELKPADTATTRTTDWSPILSLVGNDANSRSAFNDYLETWNGGALAGKGIQFDTTKNAYGIAANSNEYASLASAAQDFQADQAAKQAALDQLNGTGTGTTPGAETGTTVIDGVTFSFADLVDDGQGNYVPDPAKYEKDANGVWQKKTTTEDVENIPNQLAPILMGLASEKFNPDEYAAEFQQGVRDPAMRNFEANTRPGIREGFAGGELFGSGREKAETSALTNLESDLNAEQSNYIANARNNFTANRSTAISQAMELAQLPTSIQNAKLGAEATKASIANIFNNMDIANATLDADLTTAEISNLAILWNFFGSEQALQNSEFQAAFTNALNGDNGIQWSDIISLMNEYQGQTQTALVTS